MLAIRRWYFADLKSRGVSFEKDVADHGYGFVTYFTIPGGLRVQLYEPKYQKRAATKPRKAAAKAVKAAVKPAKKLAKKVAATAKRAGAQVKSTVKRATAKRGTAARRR
jgi:hypothetical protein